MPKPTLPLTDSQCKKLQPPNQLSDGGGLEPVFTNNYLINFNICEI